MSKISVKNKQLAKFRRFTKGMDVQEYLTTEFRQILRALENQYIEVQDGEEDQVITTDPIADDLVYLYAQHQPSLSVGVINLVDRKLNRGTVASNVFRPPSSGKFWAEFGMQMTPGIAGTVTNALVLKFSTGSAHHTLTKSVTSGQGVQYVTGKCFIDLTTSLGAYLEFTGDANTVGFNFYCSFKRIS